jgi:cilia- and flagella-associated protein 52
LIGFDIIEESVKMSASLDFEHFIGINAIPGGAAFHPNGNDYITAAGGNVIVGNLTDPHKQDFLRAHNDRVSCLALSASGSLLASGQTGDDSNVYVWDFERKSVLYKIEDHDGVVQDLAFSHDERVLATLGGPEDKKLIMWDISTGNIIASSYKVPTGTLCVTFGGFVRDIKRRDSDHYLVCTAGKDGFLMWDLDPYTGEFTPFQLAGDAKATITRTITSVCFSSCREFVYGATTSGDFLVASMRSQRIMQTVQATKLGLNAIVTIEDGILVGCGDKTIKRFDRNYELKAQIKCDGIIIGLSLSEDGLEVLATSNIGTVYRVNISAMEHIIISEGHTQPITSVTYCVGQNDRFATSSLDGTIRVWDSAEYVTLATCHARRDQERGVVPLCLQYSDIILSGWSDGQINAFSDTGENLWMIDNAHPGGVLSMTLSHNRRFILTGGPSGEVRLWELRTRDLISHLKEHVSRVTSLVLSEDDTFAITASRDRCILRWDLRDEKRVWCHMQRMGGINGVVLSQDQSHIISVGQEKRINYWGIESPDAVHSQFLDKVDPDSDEGKVIAISKDGKYIATGGTAGILRLFSYESSTLLSEAAGHSAAITSIAMSPDGKQIISVGEDGTIFFWLVFQGE